MIEQPIASLFSLIAMQILRNSAQVLQLVARVLSSCITTVKIEHTRLLSYERRVRP
jgi:hypothetical protein